MIAGIGTDIADVKRFIKWVRNPEMIERFFNEKERSEASSEAAKCEHYAVRFAAKEAFSKIPTAPDDPVTGRNIQQKNHSKTNTAAKKIAPAKTTTPEKKKGKPRS